MCLFSAKFLNFDSQLSQLVVIFDNIYENYEMLMSVFANLSWQLTNITKVVDIEELPKVDKVGKQFSTLRNIIISQI